MSQWEKSPEKIMGRPRLNRIRTHVAFEEEVYANIQLYLGDPLKNKIKHGALSTVANKLFAQFFEKLQEPGVDPLKFLEAYGVKMEK